jgi:hypothetical protein
MERTRNSVIQQRGQFRTWLDRGLDTGEIMAGGHICWTKVAQGLSGRLGEFTARYGGPTRRAAIRSSSSSQTERPQPAS